VALGHLPADRDGEITRRLIGLAHQYGIPVSWTPGSTQIRCGVEAFREELQRVRLVVLNREEVIRFCGLPGSATVEEATRALAARTADETMVVATNGGETPAVCLDGRHNDCYSVPPPEIHVLDPTGAGDAFHAGLVVGLILGLPIEDSLDLARQKAAVVCQVWGGTVDGFSGVDSQPPHESLFEASPSVLEPTDSPGKRAFLG
jgi:sugar/nucleoside kinase (ribokinase family)